MRNRELGRKGRKKKDGSIQNNLNLKNKAAIKKIGIGDYLGRRLGLRRV